MCGPSRRRGAAENTGDISGFASAAERVNVSGLDSWLALVEQPPRTDEDPETQNIARAFPQRSGQAFEMTANRIELHPWCAL
jgi:hypothetical protein